MAGPVLPIMVTARAIVRGVDVSPRPTSGAPHIDHRDEIIAARSQRMAPCR